MITWGGRSTDDIKRRIPQAKTAFTMKRQLLCSKKIELQTRKQYVKTFLWSVALYISEERTIEKVNLTVSGATWWNSMLEIKSEK
jgi:hypothetical protein